MQEQNNEKQRQLVVRIASMTNKKEQEALQRWIEQLLEIKASSLSKSQKTKQAIVVTSNEVLFPTVRIIARETKRLAWDDRGLKGRAFIGASVTGLALFGSQGAGIAALGTAIGVPLWAVFGAGATFLAALYEEITGKKPNPKTTYRVIDADPEKEK